MDGGRGALKGGVSLFWRVVRWGLFVSSLFGVYSWVDGGI